MKKYISPCSAATEKIATELDVAIIAKDIESLDKRIEEALLLVESESVISKATIYYCLGTAYGSLADINGTETEESLKSRYIFFVKV